LQNTLSKITRVKWTGSVAQAVECLFCKHKALSSNPNLTKNKKEEEEEGDIKELPALCLPL
jgi:hypothetical protein